ncbi:histidinol dehydrogenase [Candidatus Woesearchaeota archaeon]|nr:histidinol dehydrogenase [Candidatus Woesearchaeota archaeon]
MQIVRQILKDIRENGDVAVRKYTEQFDRNAPDSFEISMEEVRKAYSVVSTKTIASMRKAARNIREFSKKQLSQLRDFEMAMQGMITGQKVIPLDAVGCYVPGGRYPLPSTALMTIIPAKIAGVKTAIVCSPNIRPETIVAADLAGADRIFNIGGIQAIGSMAYGTETVPKVNKIVGPGNKYVAAAKKEVYGEVGIDFIAGPSEILIIADETGNAGFIAADMLAQAEHDSNARAFLVTPSKKLAEKVKVELEQQLPCLKTREVAEKSISNSSIILVKGISQAIDAANRIAPEHLGLQVKNEKFALERLRNYGSLFIGDYSAEAFGDYASGTNHVLPTNRAAKYTGGLSAKDFVKIVTYQKIDKNGASKLARIATALAEVEGLDAHKKAAAARLKQKDLNS